MVPISKFAALGPKARPTKQIRSDLGNLHARLRMIHQQGPVAATAADFVLKHKDGLIAGGVALTLLGSYLAWNRLGYSKALGSSVGVDANPSVGLRKTDLGILEHTFVPMDHEAAERLLKLHEIKKTFKPSETKSVVTRFDCNHVDCNQVGEDRHVEDFLSKDILSSKCVVATTEDEAWLQLTDTDNGSLKLFSVIDGHGGVAMADLLVQRLHPAIVRSLRSAKGRLSVMDPLSSMRKDEGGVTAFLQAYQPFESVGCITTPSTEGRSDEDEPFTFNADTISAALSCAYTDLDYEVCIQPLKLLFNPSESIDKSNVQKSLSQAVAGACASTVLVDEDRQEVHVANAGDSRVVAGYWVPPRTWPDGTRFLGGWRCEVLTGDHTAKDLVELDRLKQDHAGENDLIEEDSGRVLGNLAVTRAFGDASWYKWTDEETRAIVGRMEHPPLHVTKPCKLFDDSTHLSPPYITAMPGVTMRSLEGTDEPQGHLKFIIAASDGLWDFLSSEEAVGLVATHLEHPLHAPISREAVKSGLIEESKRSTQMHPGPRPKDKERPGVWLYEDTNAATHLIRNAWNFSNQVETVRDMLSINPPQGRWFKDDVTCSVIFFDPPSPSADVAEPVAKGSDKGWLANLLHRWEHSPLKMDASSIGWRPFPLAHI